MFSLITQNTRNSLLKTSIYIKQFTPYLGAATLLGTIALFSTSASACPVVKSVNEMDRVNSMTDDDGETIYFCKQTFDASQLGYQPTETDLLTGGSRAIAMGNTIQTFPMTNSVNLSGFTPSQLNLNSITSNLPTNGGQYGEMNIFNFYTRVSSASNSCTTFNNTNQFTKITDYLRANANIFQANGGAQTGVSTNVGNNLAVIRDIPIAHDSQTGAPIRADITFYHANAGQGGQWFTAGSKRFCWVGVSSRVNIKTDGTNGSNLKHSGDYVVNVGVLTQ